MALMQYGGPLPWMRDVERRMDDLLRRTLGGDWPPFGSWGGFPAFRGLSEAAWSPAVDVFSRGDDLVIRAELPGVDPEKDVEITYLDGALTIRGERRREHRSEGDRYWRVETSYGAFERTVPLPDEVKAEDIQASHRDGILEVVIPRAAALAPARKIPVRVETARRKVLPARDSKK